MGNRAVLTCNKNLEETGIYIHWNGGRDSVEAFLAYCDLKGFRRPEDDNYGWACLTRVISNFFASSIEDGLSIGVDNCKYLDCNNWDNGVYIIKNWRIVDRMFYTGKEQQEYDFMDMLREIDKSQPDNVRLNAEQWAKAEEMLEDIKKYRKTIYKRDEKGRFAKD